VRAQPCVNLYHEDFSQFDHVHHTSPSAAPEEASQDVQENSEDPDGSHGTGGFEVAASVVRAVVIDNTTMSGERI